VELSSCNGWVQIRLVPDRLTLKVPPECPNCHRPHTITLEQTIKGDTVIFEWCCRACNHSWPVRKEAA